MKIDSKYSVGDRIWVVYSHQGEVHIYDDVVSDVCVNNGGLYYILDAAGIDKKEEELILHCDEKRLLEKIEETMQEIHKREG